MLWKRTFSFALDRSHHTHTSVKFNDRYENDVLPVDNNMMLLPVPVNTKGKNRGFPCQSSQTLHKTHGVQTIKNITTKYDSMVKNMIK